MRKEAGKQNNIDFMSMWAGQAAYLCKALPAAQLIEELNSEAIALKQSP
jgi:nitronate monooxygenase